MKIYLSGPISKVKDLNSDSFRSFKAKYEKLGHQVINPLDLQAQDPDKHWADYMRMDIAALLQCDAVAVLDDWENSDGSTIEIHLAQKLGMQVFFAHTDKPFNWHLKLKASYENVK